MSAPTTKPAPDLKSPAGRRLLIGTTLDAALALAAAGRYQTEVVYPRAAITLKARDNKQLVLFLADDGTVEEVW